MPLPIMHDLGTKPEPMEMTAPGKAEPKKFYPSIHSIDLDKLPALDIYDTGDEVMLVIKGYISDKRISNAGAKDEKTNFEIELREASVMDVGMFKKMRESGMSRKAVKKSEYK